MPTPLAMALLDATAGFARCKALLSDNSDRIVGQALLIKQLSIEVSGEAAEPTQRLE